MSAGAARPAIRTEAKRCMDCLTDREEALPRASANPRADRGRRIGRAACSGRSWLRPLGRRLSVALLAAACGVAMAGPAPAAPRSYAIDPRASSVHVLLYRAGVFAMLAHDHVLVASGFAGRVSVDPADLTQAALRLTLPVASLQVDPPELRKALGIAGELNDADRAEQLRNGVAEGRPGYSRRDSPKAPEGGS